MPNDDEARYAELEAGARYLAAGTVSSAERDEHLAMADRFAGRRRAAVRWGKG
ncbi:MAG TPA: hypothetical protein VF702_09490 [Allosphingosinicella sp.]|jgi:hypothetical protein